MLTSKSTATPHSTEKVDPVDVVGETVPGGGEGALPKQFAVQSSSLFRNHSRRLADIFSFEYVTRGVAKSQIESDNAPVHVNTDGNTSMHMDILSLFD